MKVDEPTLQNILKAYGKELKPRKNKLPMQKQEKTGEEKVSRELKSEDLDIINYDKEGNVSIDIKKKDALIDFFQ
jgi:hypothetical protein